MPLSLDDFSSLPSAPGISLPEVVTQIGADTLCTTLKDYVDCSAFVIPVLVSAVIGSVCELTVSWVHSVVAERYAAVTGVIVSQGVSAIPLHLRASRVLRATVARSLLVHLDLLLQTSTLLRHPLHRVGFRRVPNHLSRRRPRSHRRYLWHKLRVIQQFRTPASRRRLDLLFKCRLAGHNADLPTDESVQVLQNTAQVSQQSKENIHPLRLGIHGVLDPH